MSAPASFRANHEKNDQNYRGNLPVSYARGPDDQIEEKVHRGRDHEDQKEGKIVSERHIRIISPLTAEKPQKEPEQGPIHLTKICHYQLITIVVPRA